MSVLDLVRDDLRGFGGYKSARTEALRGDVWLNANESAWGNPADPDAACRRYPDPQPAALRAALADLYDVAAERLLIGRGSDEAIDLLVRATCVPGRDRVGRGARRESFRGGRTRPRATSFAVRVSRPCGAGST